MFPVILTERLIEVNRNGEVADGFQLCRHGDALLKILLEESIEVAVLGDQPCLAFLLSQFVSG